jgi:hypothetical protein
MRRDRDQLWTVVIEPHSIGRLWAIPACTLEIEAQNAYLARQQAVRLLLAEAGVEPTWESMHFSLQWATATEASRGGRS